MIKHISLMIIFLVTLLSLNASQGEQNSNVKPSQPSVLAQIQELRKQNKLDSAQKIAKEHLKTHPNDVDVMLLMGLMYYQQANLKQAEFYLSNVLRKTPTYLDAKIGLIRVKVAQKKLKEAHILLEQAVKQSPKDPTVKEIQIFYDKAEKAEKTKNTKKKAQPKKKLSFLEQEIKNGNLFCAQLYINKQLAFCPCNAELLAQKSNIYFLRHQYEQSACLSYRALAIDPNNAKAKEMISNVKEVNPHKLYGLNEIGLSSFNQHVSDLRSNWDFSTLYYARATPIGAVYAKLNWAARIRNRAPQEELEMWPVINQYITFDIDGTHANNPVLFPKYSYLVEGYGTIPDWVTLSLGGNYNYILHGTYYRKYTASISKDFKNDWVSFRLNRYMPSSGHHSTLGIATFRHYFSTIDFFINLTVGAGTSPDLADLETLNFLVIQNRFANLGLRFPICNHQTLIDIGFDYQHWKYPTGLLRRLYGVNLGISYAF